MAFVLFLIATTLAFELSFGATSVSNHELDSLMTSLWHKDSNRASHSDVTYSIQSHAYDTNTDHASRHFFSHVNEAHLFTKPTYVAFFNLINNFHRDETTTEHVTSSQSDEIDHYLSEVMKTTLMDYLYIFMHSKGVVHSETDFKNKLRSLWFSLYSRSHGVVGSSGFEHVFVGETTPTAVSGLHNWLQFYLEEKKGHINYLGYAYTKEPNIVGVRFTWYGKPKTLTSLVIGTSPEFELAVYTACYYFRKDGTCSFNMAGDNMRVKSYDISYLRGDQIGTAYFD